MTALTKRFNFLFQSTKGLVLLAIALISIVTVVWGMLSGPMAEFGIRDFVIHATGMQLLETEREGRIILLYHTIAMGIVAIETYLITAMVPMKSHQHSQINATVTFGYILSMIFGLSFGYFGHNFVFHGLYLFGLSLMFFTGILLSAALWPWRVEYQVSDRVYAHLGKLDLERTAFFVMAVATLGSALFGAVTGSYWGNGHETFLAEDLIREPEKTILQKSIIGHLHIMLTLIAIAITLIVGRWVDFKGVLHKIAMPLMIIGTIIISIGAWSVVVVEWAHTIIYGGSVMVMLAALMYVIFSWDKLIRTGLAEKGIQKGGIVQKIRALLRDPLRFGPGWQMVFMNFTVSGIGIFMAVKLDEIFRRLAASRRAYYPHRSLAHSFRSDRHHHLAPICRYDRLERQGAALVRLGGHYIFRSGLRFRHHIFDEAFIRNRIGTRTCGELDHAARRHRISPCVSNPRLVIDLASVRSIE